MNLPFRWARPDEAVPSALTQYILRKSAMNPNQSGIYDGRRLPDHDTIKAFDHSFIVRIVRETHDS
jgi:hypothetical protein